MLNLKKTSLSCTQIVIVKIKPSSAVVFYFICFFVVNFYFYLTKDKVKNLERFLFLKATKFKFVTDEHFREDF